MDKLEKSTVKEYFGCRKCGEKLITVEVSSGLDLLGFGSSKTKFLYCNSDKCERFGDITIVGVKKTE